MTPPRSLQEEGVLVHAPSLRGTSSAEPGATTRKKGVYVGAPACFALDLACQHLNTAFGGFGCYLVGSALERPDWRDIDVRLLLTDEEFEAEFPGTLYEDRQHGGTWEMDTKWLVLTTAISAWLTAQTGLPVDFQIQPQTHANARHKGPRNALGMGAKP